jgi:hypothetical protein
MIVLDSTRGRTTRTSLGSAKGRPSSTHSARASSANDKIVTQIGSIVEDNYQDTLLPALAEHLNHGGKHFVQGAAENQTNASAAYWTHLASHLGEESEEWKSTFEPMSKDTRLSLFFAVVKKWRADEKTRKTEASTAAAGPSAGGSNAPSSDPVTAASTRPRRTRKLD